MKQTTSKEFDISEIFLHTILHLKYVYTFDNDHDLEVYSIPLLIRPPLCLMGDDQLYNVIVTAHALVIIFL